MGNISRFSDPEYNEDHLSQVLRVTTRSSTLECRGYMTLCSKSARHWDSESDLQLLTSVHIRPWLIFVANVVVQRDLDWQAIN
jgi:hypothetical protein